MFCGQRFSANLIKPNELAKHPSSKGACCSEERKVIKFLDRKLFWGEQLMTTNMVNFEKSFKQKRPGVDLFQHFNLFSKFWTLFKMFKMLTHFRNVVTFSKCWPISKTFYFDFLSIFKVLTHFKMLTCFNILTSFQNVEPFSKCKPFSRFRAYYSRFWPIFKMLSPNGCKWSKSVQMG